MTSQPQQMASVAAINTAPTPQQRSNAGSSNTPISSQNNNTNTMPNHTSTSSTVTEAHRNSINSTSSASNGTSNVNITNSGPSTGAAPASLSSIVSPDLSNSIPEDLKPHIAPYVQRAIELSTREPVMCYWCLFFAAKQGIAIGNKDDRLYLFNLMETIEKIKNELRDASAVFSDEVGAAYVKEFANKVFMLADSEDRAGSATRSTAKKFLAAANFYGLLSVFDINDEAEVNQKIQYSKWRAGTIAKKVKGAGEATPSGLQSSTSWAQAQNEKANNVPSGTQGRKPTPPIEQANFQSQFLSVPHPGTSSAAPLPSPITSSTFGSVPASGTATPHRPFHTSPNAAAEKIPLPLSPQAPYDNLKPISTPVADVQAKLNHARAGSAGTSGGVTFPSASGATDQKSDGGKEANPREPRVRKRSSADKNIAGPTTKSAVTGVKDVNPKASQSTTLPGRGVAQLPDGQTNPDELSDHATPGLDDMFKRVPSVQSTGSHTEKASGGASTPNHVSPPSSANSKLGAASRTTPIPPSPFSSTTHSPVTPTFPPSTAIYQSPSSGETAGKKVLATAPPGSTLVLERERRQSFRRSEPYVLPTVGLVVPPSLSLSSGIGIPGSKVADARNGNPDSNTLPLRVWMKPFTGPNPVKFPLPVSVAAQATPATQASTSASVSGPSKSSATATTDAAITSTSHSSSAPPSQPSSNTSGKASTLATTTSTPKQSLTKSPELKATNVLASLPQAALKPVPAPEVRGSPKTNNVPVAVNSSLSKSTSQIPSHNNSSEKPSALLPLASDESKVFAIPPKLAEAAKRAPPSSTLHASGDLDHPQSKDIAALDLAKKAVSALGTPTLPSLPLISPISVFKKVHFSDSVKGGLSSIASNSPPHSPEQVVREVTIDIPTNGPILSSTESTDTEDEGKDKDEDSRTVKFGPPGLTTDACE
ncbi:Vta1 like-domain-containing protein [Cantharellus anzutake]|uniref:Vta1 like-domain-containing protein n=1 Tax=Cantharellus anzutake TaxID=1750568 RepID=UPI0019090175|nr:Vta1 like-domain-containing protein [Cantharellus anzutake]KAF8326046.1 Vta1 like-domain-containing protein [Cantharellus anzutake]